MRLLCHLIFKFNIKPTRDNRMPAMLWCRHYMKKSTYLCVEKDWKGRLYEIKTAYFQSAAIFEMKYYPAGEHKHWQKISTEFTDWQFTGERADSILYLKACRKSLPVKTFPSLTNLNIKSTHIFPLPENRHRNHWVLV